MNKKTLFRAASGLVAGAALALAVPLSASAHVHVIPNQATPGSTAQLSFRVPSESATAGTVGLEIDLPSTTPFTSVSAETMPGWSSTIQRQPLAKPVTIDGTKVTEAPSKVIFTADTGTQIPPGQFAMFTLSLGPVPDVGSVLLPAIQHYSDGTVVAWNQPTPASGTEPEHPAPTLYIDDAPPADGTDIVASATSSPAPGGTSTGVGTASSPSRVGDALAIGLGLGGLVLGAIALVVSVYSATRRRVGR